MIPHATRKGANIIIPSGTIMRRSGEEPTRSLRVKRRAAVKVKVAEKEEGVKERKVEKVRAEKAKVAKGKASQEKVRVIIGITEYETQTIRTIIRRAFPRVTCVT